jgi:RNA polymerase sigma factor (TIGR02999 family)
MGVRRDGAEVGDGMNVDANNECVASDGVVTAELLRRCSAGDTRAYDTLFSSIYEELHRRARRLPRMPGTTLSTTALVHETYLKLAGASIAPSDKIHFFALAARAMRQVLLNAARDRAAQKRGGGQIPATLDSGLVAGESATIDLVALDRALENLATSDERLAQVVELHFFGGLEFAEIGQLTGVSERTVARDWRAARAMLLLQLDG